MRILLTGAAGMLGSAVIPELSKDYEVIPTDIQPGMRYLDVRDTIEVIHAVWDTDLVVHMAALTDLEYCEANPKEAYKTNVIGTINVAQTCNTLNVPMVYIGTAGIFDGTKATPYIETDIPNPINIYGKTKYEGEVWTQRFLPDISLIVRAGWMVGGNKLDHKFVAKILSQLSGGAPSIYAVTDKIGTPTYTVDFARNLHALIDRNIYGTYHMVCNGDGLSRFKVAQKIVEITRFKATVVPVTSAFFEFDYPVARPKSEALENRALQNIGMNLMRNWEDALKEYLV